MTKAEIYSYFYLAVSEFSDEHEDGSEEIDTDEVLALFTHLLENPWQVVQH